MKPVIYMDWDGTIADSMELCIAEVRAAILGIGMTDMSDSVLAQCNGPTNEESIALLGIPEGRGQEYLALRAKAEIELSPDKQKLFPGMKETLRRLSTAADLIVVSNGNSAYLRASAEYMGVKDCFRHLEGFRKGCTKADNLARLMKQYPSKRAVMVGDRAGDMLSGKANGLPTMAACYGYGTQKEWEMADKQAHTVAELEKMLEDFCQA